MENFREDLIYLKGFLDSLAYMNTFTNDGKTYTVELLDKVNYNYQDTFRKRFNKKHWLVETQLINENWRQFLKDNLRPYFDQIIREVYLKINKKDIYNEKGHLKEGVEESIDKIRLDIDFHIDHLYQEKFLDSLEKIVGKTPLLYRVDIDTHPIDTEYEGYYESSWNDYLFDLDTKILFLHFGSSD
jgi:hypothetical protein